MYNDPVIFRDPLAERMVADLEAVWSFKARPPNSRLSGMLRAFVAARSRYAEDELHHSSREVSGSTLSSGQALIPLPIAIRTRLS